MSEQKESQLFRKVSLERLSSPDQLDMLTKVTTPSGWIALTVLGAILGMAIIWGFYGNIPIKVNGQGILLSEGGVSNVVSLGNGQVTEIVVKENDTVRSGQVVARIAQPTLLNELRNAKNELEDVKTQSRQLTDFSNKDTKSQSETMASQIKTIKASISNLGKRAEFIRGQITKQQQLLEKGLVMPAKVEASKQELASILEQISTQQIKIDELQGQGITLRNKSASTKAEYEFKINGLERNIASMENRLTYDSRVVSKVSGKVIEIKVSVGSVVNTGAPIISIEQQDKRLEAVLYVSAAEGKKIKPGMEIDIVPASVKKEEFGNVLALVSAVSDYPATVQGMTQQLGNEGLANSLANGSSPYEIHAELIPDNNTVSGYKWSSGKGPPLAIQTGTLCAGEIVVEQKRPMLYVIPYVKKKLGL
ncbi:MAG: NHLP bacteriocin system secretion protein [Proteobacteria bacterium]|nr:NHLP bacteriocin system secretion protein [Pseudomonadota bacterium]